MYLDQNLEYDLEHLLNFSFKLFKFLYFFKILTQIFILRKPEFFWQHTIEGANDYSCMKYELNSLIVVLICQKYYT